MKKTLAVLSLSVFSASMFAQGPHGFGGPRGGPGMGPGGFGGRGPGLLGAGPGPQVTVTGAPYSATETLSVQQTLTGGNQIARKQQSLIYRDSQGRVRTEETITPPAASGKAPFTVISIFDPVAGLHYMLNSSTMTAVQMPLPKAHTPRTNPPTPPADAPPVVTTSLGVQVINGVAATGTQITETIPAGAIGNAQPIQVIRTSWISNELKVPVQIKTSDPRFGNTDMELTSIVQAEPNASLFVVPAGYTTQQGRGGAASAFRPEGRMRGARD